MGLADFKSGSTLRLGDYIGGLFLVWPRSYETGIRTHFQEAADAVRADLVNLDAAAGPEKFLDVLLFQGQLIRSLRRYIGKGPILVRLRLGEKRPGRNQAYVWEAAQDTPADRKLAEGWLSENGDDPFTSSASTSEMSKPLTLSEGEQDDLLGLGDEL